MLLEVLQEQLGRAGAVVVEAPVVRVRELRFEGPEALPHLGELGEELLLVRGSFQGFRSGG